MSRAKPITLSDHEALEEFHSRAAHGTWMLVGMSQSLCWMLNQLVQTNLWSLLDDMLLISYAFILLCLYHFVSVCRSWRILVRIVSYCNLQTVCGNRLGQTLPARSSPQSNSFRHTKRNTRFGAGGKALACSVNALISPVYCVLCQEVVCMVYILLDENLPPAKMCSICDRSTATHHHSFWSHIWEVGQQLGCPHWDEPPSGSHCVSGQSRQTPRLGLQSKSFVTRKATRVSWEPLVPATNGTFQVWQPSSLTNQELTCMHTCRKQDKNWWNA